MKSRLFLLILPGFFIVACTSSADKAAKQKADSLAAVAHMDSMMNAAKVFHDQNAANADSTKKVDSTGTKK
jgi:hypothetical protein